MTASELSELCIKVAEASDISVIMKLINQSDMSPDNPLTDTAALRLFEQMKEAGNHLVFIALLGDEVVGTYAMVEVQSLTHGGRKSAVIEDVVVDRHVRGLGVGRAMLAHAAQMASEHGCAKLVLSSGLARPEAHAFYQKLGYRHDGVRFSVEC